MIDLAAWLVSLPLVLDGHGHAIPRPRAAVATVARELAASIPVDGIVADVGH